MSTVGAVRAASATNRKRKGIDVPSLPLRDWNTVIRWCELPGAGVPIVCLPGLSFAAVPNFLSLVTQPEFRGRRILMVDYIGSGLSGHSQSFGFSLDEHSTSIAAVLDTACDEPVHLLGYSMGGTVAVSLALSRPDLVSRLVICEGNLLPGGGEASRRIAATDQHTFIANDFPERMRGLAQAATDGVVLPDFLWAARSGADPKGVHGNARALVDLPEGFAQRFLALSLERHFVYGEKTFPGNTGISAPDQPDPDLLKTNGVRIHVVPGVGHSMMIDDPVATSRVLGTLL